MISCPVVYLGKIFSIEDITLHKKNWKDHVFYIISLAVSWDSIVIKSFLGCYFRPFLSSKGHYPAKTENQNILVLCLTIYCVVTYEVSELFSYKLFHCYIPWNFNVQEMIAGTPTKKEDQKRLVICKTTFMS